MFSKRHYEFLVEEINNRYKIIKSRNSNGVEFKKFVFQLADAFSRDNYKFNKELFLEKVFDNS